MSIYLEIFGYIGSILLMISMMMTSMVKLRIINIIGSIISTVYSIVHGAYAVVFLNIGMMGINIYHLIRSFRAMAVSKAEKTADADATDTVHKPNNLEETI
ncbi:MAG: uroporphyrinogen decarboxylase [Ruminococcaceae bacterium]|nr:uroporphyrinogen decarboxylase [Oscillospiraceae bacterium]